VCVREITHTRRVLIPHTLGVLICWERRPRGASVQGDYPKGRAALGPGGHHRPCGDRCGKRREHFSSFKIQLLAGITGVRGLKFMIEGLRCEVYSVGCEVDDVGCEVYGVRLTVWGPEFRGLGFEVLVPSFGSLVSERLRFSKHNVFWWRAQGLKLTLGSMHRDSTAIHPTPYTLHPTPYTLHPTPHTLP